LLIRNGRARQTHLLLLLLLPSIPSTNRNISKIGLRFSQFQTLVEKYSINYLCIEYLFLQLIQLVAEMKKSSQRFV